MKSIVQVLVGLACWLGVFLAGRTGAARECSAEYLAELRVPSPKCSGVSKRRKLLRACTQVDVGDRAFTRLALDKEYADKDCDACSDAELRLAEQLTGKAASCIEQYGNLVVARQMVACLGGKSGHHQQQLTELERSVAQCSCADGAAVEFRPPKPRSCSDATPVRRRVEMWGECATRPAHWKENLSAAKAFESSCRAPEKSRTKREVFAEVRLRLEQINERIAKDPRCFSQEGCPEQRIEQLRHLALYLEFFARGTTTNAEDVKHARGLLSGVGLPSHWLEALANLGPEERAEAMRLGVVWQAGTNENLLRSIREKLADDPEALSAFEMLLQLMKDRTPPAEIKSRLDSIPPERRRKLYRVALSATNQQRSAEQRKLNEKELNGLDIIVATPHASEVCSPFVNGVLHGIVGPVPAPIRVNLPDWEEKVAEQLERRRSTCGVARAGQQGPAKADQGCGTIFALRVQSGELGKLQVEVTLHLVYAAAHGDVRTPGWSEKFTFDSSRAAQEARAEELVDDFFMKLEAPPPPELPRAAAEQCGMKMLPPKALAPSPKRTAYRLEVAPPAIAGLEAKQQAFSRQFAHELGVWSSVVGRRDDSAPTRIAVNFGTPEGAGSKHYKIEVNLVQRGQPDIPLFASGVLIDDAEVCPNDKEAEYWRWSVAATLVARSVLDYYRGVAVEVPVPTTNELTARLLLPGADWWRSENPAKAGGGILWSVVDVGLLGGGVLMLGLSIEERNDYARGQGSLHRATSFQYAGFAMLGGFLVERMIWGFVGPE